MGWGVQECETIIACIERGFSTSTSPVLLLFPFPHHHRHHRLITMTWSKGVERALMDSSLSSFYFSASYHLSWQDCQDTVRSSNEMNGRGESADNATTPLLGGVVIIAENVVWARRGRREGRKDDERSMLMSLCFWKETSSRMKTGSKLLRSSKAVA